MIGAVLLAASLVYGFTVRRARIREAGSREQEDELRSEIRSTVLSSLNQEYILSHITTLLHDRLGFERTQTDEIENE